MECLNTPQLIVFEFFGRVRQPSLGRKDVGLVEVPGGQVGGRLMDAD